MSMAAITPSWLSSISSTEGSKRKNYCNGEVKSQVIVTGSVGGFIPELSAERKRPSRQQSCSNASCQVPLHRLSRVCPSESTHSRRGLFPSDLAAPVIYKKKNTTSLPARTVSLTGSACRRSELAWRKTWSERCCILLRKLGFTIKLEYSQLKDINLDKLGAKLA